MSDTPYLPLLSGFFRKLHRTDYSRGEVIYESDSDYQRVFYINKGYVKSYFISSDGGYNMLTIYGPNSIFPLGPTLRKDIGRTPFHLLDTVYFEAIIDVDLYFSKSDDMFSFCEKNPKAYKEMLTALVRNYDLYLSRVEASIMKHARQRIAHQLIVLASSFSSETYGQRVLDVPLTHQDIADSLGMARETVSREMEAFKHDGLVDVKDQHIIITDIEKLSSEREY